MTIFKGHFAGSPYKFYLPFLLLYILLVVFFHADAMQGDEGRYYQFAQNLVNGFYSPPPPDINLWNGPGYPILLMPFVALKLPLITITLLNAFLFYLAVVLLYKTLALFGTAKHARIFSLFLAFYYISYSEMCFILTETFTIFLVSSVLYFFCASFFTPSLKTNLLAGFILGFLVLTKIAFGYVLLASIIASLAWFALSRSVHSRRVLMIVAIALLTNLPYLLYTYQLTGKYFYWGNAGGMSLYWMSSPHQGEFGDWHPDRKEELVLDCGNEANPGLLPCNAEFVEKVHAKDFEYISQFKGVARDDAYKQLAIANIKAKPLKFFENCLLNVGRLFFNYPYSYTYQKKTTLFYFPPNCLVLVLLIFSIIATAINLKRIPLPLKAILVFLIFYFAISIIVSAYPRQLSAVLPMLLTWFGFITYHTTQIRMKIKNQP